MKNQTERKHFFYRYFFAASLIGFSGLVLYASAPSDDDAKEMISARNGEKHEITEEKQHVPPKHIVADTVKAVYVTMHTAGIGKKMDALIALADATEVNAMVIDVKGSQGELVFDMLDAPALVARLHERGIYAIARIVVFQDSGAAVRAPDTVIKKTGGGVWRDRRGFAWVDPAAEKGWDYVFDISKRALDIGFDEINYDYIRFPTDGNLGIMEYPAWTKDVPQHAVIAKFAARAREVLKAYDPQMKLSIDIFGYTFLQSSGLGIGQRLEDTIAVFDGVYPMVYPSHYSAGNFGFTNPADHPYEVVKGTLEKGLAQLGDSATSSAAKIRPWLQAFDLGAVYTPEKMRAQIRATEDGLLGESTGWLLWDPGNEYDNAYDFLGKE